MIDQNINFIVVSLEIIVGRFARDPDSLVGSRRALFNSPHKSIGPLFDRRNRPKHGRIDTDVAPTAMIFVPCEKGISHNEAENMTADDAAAGCNVLLHAILERAS